MKTAVFFKNGRIIRSYESISQKSKLENQRLHLEHFQKNLSLQQEQFQKDSIYIIESYDTKETGWRRKFDFFFFTAEAIVNSITEFKYCSEEGVTFPFYFRKNADLYKKEC